MSKNKLDLSVYRDSETLAPSFSTKTKLQILKDYLSAKEQKYKKLADNAGITSVITGVMSPLTLTAIGTASLTTPGFNEYPPAIALGATAITGITTSAITYVISKRARAKQSDYRYLKECTNAGIQSNETLEKARVYLRAEDRTPNTLKTIEDIICPRPPQYINSDNFTISEEEKGL